VLIRTFGEIEQDNVVVVSAGVAFFALFGSIPALTALVSVYGLVSPAEEVAEQISQALPMLTPGVQELLREALDNVVKQSAGALSLGAMVGLAVSFWTASRGTRALLRAINIAYDEEGMRRGIIKDNALAYLFTVGAVVSVLLTFGLVIVLPAALAGLGLRSGATIAMTYLRWPMLFVLVAGGLAVLYRHGAIRRAPKWRWVWVGAISATALWLCCSMTMSAYIAFMADFRATYGPLGAVVVLLLWLFVSSFVILMGAELNAELEHQTRTDTTVGPELALGERGAWVADHVGGCRPLPRWLRAWLGGAKGGGADERDDGGDGDEESA
jgi:membrane protein